MADPFVVRARRHRADPAIPRADQLERRPLDPGGRDPPRRPGSRPPHLRLRRRSTRNEQPKSGTSQKPAGRLHPRRRAFRFPPGVAKRIPPGSDLLFEVHYTPIGKPGSTARPSAWSFPRSRPSTWRSPEASPAGACEFPLEPPIIRSKAAWTTDRDIHLLSLSPHMHLRGKSFEFVARVSRRTPGNPSLRAALRLQLAERLSPRRAQSASQGHADSVRSRTTTIHRTTWPTPIPTRPSLWGEQTWDEMMIGFIDYYEDELADC